MPGSKGFLLPIFCDNRLVILKMCGRYSNHIDAMRTWVRILGDWPKDVTLSYNVSPTQRVAVFTAQEGVGMRWGLIPHWSKDGKSKYATFNARIETVDSKPVYRTAWDQSQRCLVPAQGFYEWRSEDGRKQPYFVASETGDPLVFAGLWDVWKGNDAEALSCTILTRPSEGILAKLHPRMPVIVEQGYVRDWFRASLDEVKQLLDIQKADVTFYKVGASVNNPRNDGPELIGNIRDIP
jgi:putative SOS response-associated peptidase YedK